jgi:hypothetical protein
MSMEEMKDLVQSAGLEIIEVYPVGFFHPPKVRVSYRLNCAIDRAASRFKCLSRFSESPIAVCRWRRNCGGDDSTPRK